MPVKRYRQVAAFILVGGASSRMGRDKTLLKIAGAPLVVRTARALEPLVTNVTVVGSVRNYAALGLHAMDDHVPARAEAPLPHQGPLAGISRALNATSAPWNLIVASDLPYLSTEWISWLLARAVDSEAQLVIPRTRHGLEPLAAVYRRECAGPISAAFYGGVRKVTEALAGLRMETIDAHEWKALDPDGRILKNMNTPADYAEARKWWAAKGRRERNQVRRPRSTRP
jgi:molybdopterin-guanine dinucleotide biosynthesis protein A